MRNGGNDAVNNVEQVSVLTPAAGTWTVQVSSNTLPMAPQAFAVAGALTRSDLVLVMDRSGSMTEPSGAPMETKLEALQDAANEFVDLLDLAGGHSLGLVQFQETVVPFAPAFNFDQLDAGHRDDAHDAINSMNAGGWTNIIGGIEAGITQLNSATPAAPRQTIVVFSDGHHNRPLGTTLSDVAGSLPPGAFRFYSIGFGTDVDDAALTALANANQGIHVNEQALSPQQLTKYFLTVAALSQDLTVFVDPPFEVGAGQPAQQPFDVTTSDRTVYVAVNWTDEKSVMSVSLQSPDPQCKVSGLAERSGATYRLLRLDLPNACGHAGRWTVTAMPVRIAGERRRERVDIMVIGDSRLKLDGFVEQDRERRRFVVGARLAGVRDAEIVSMTAHHIAPLPRTNDSERADQNPSQAPRPASQYEQQRERVMKLKTPKKKRAESVTTTFDAARLEPGLHQVRLVATIRHNGQDVQRETLVSFHVNK